NEVDPLIDNSHISIKAQGLQNLCLLTALYRNLPNTGCNKCFRVIKELAVRGLQGSETALSSHLGLGSATGWDFPHLGLSCAHGIKVNPAPIVRPAGIAIVRRIGCQAARFTSVGIDGINVILSFCG